MCACALVMFVHGEETKEGPRLGSTLADKKQTETESDLGHINIWLTAWIAAPENIFRTNYARSRCKTAFKTDTLTSTSRILSTNNSQADNILGFTILGHSSSGTPTSTCDIEIVSVHKARTMLHHLSIHSAAKSRKIASTPSEQVGHVGVGEGQQPLPVRGSS
jgi:hypothetical protein